MLCCVTEGVKQGGLSCFVIRCRSSFYMLFPNTTSSLQSFYAYLRKLSTGHLHAEQTFDGEIRFCSSERTGWR